jgi:raffinose/stachyose/melibiose transport system permease protein
MIATTTGVVFICSLAAFVFALHGIPRKGLTFNLFTMGLMFPITVAILPVYLVLRQMSRLITLKALFSQVAFLLSGNILILRSSFMAIPIELQDAA